MPAFLLTFDPFFLLPFLPTEANAETLPEPQRLKPEQSDLLTGEEQKTLKCLGIQKQESS